MNPSKNGISLCTYEQVDIRVSLAAPTAGWTIARPNEQGAHTIARHVDVEKFFDIYFGTLL